jgi:hypothetical protein
MQEAQLADEFLNSCDRLANPEFNDPMLEEFYSMAPTVLAEKPDDFLKNMVKYFDQQDTQDLLKSKNTNVEYLKRLLLAGRTGSGVREGTVPSHRYFSVTTGGDFVIRRKNMMPSSFNVSNGVIGKLMPKLLRPSQKFGSEQVSEDYI